MSLPEDQRTMECRVCGGQSASKGEGNMSLVYDVGLEFLRCDRCGSFRLPDHRLLKSHVEPDRVGLSLAMRMLFSVRLRWLRRQVPELGKHAEILDVGCGDGQFLQYLMSRGYKSVKGVEPEKARRDQAERAGVTALEDLAHYQKKADVIFLWHVLEHMDAPSGELGELVKRLNPGGVLLVSIPNHDSYQARWFGRYSCYLDYGRHLWYWGTGFPETVAGILPRQDVRPLDGINWEYEVFGWVDSMGSAFTKKENFIHSGLKKKMEASVNDVGAMLLAGALLPLGLAMSCVMQAFPERQGTITLAIRNAGPRESNE